MSYKRKHNTTQKFETDNSKKGFVRIFRDMILSEAWRALTTRQIGLYFLFKSKFTIVNGDPNTYDISLTTPEVEKHYKGNMEAFREDVDALIEHGFIKCLFRGKSFRLPNQYAFSDKWKLYGTESFNITNVERREDLEKQLLKKQLKKEKRDKAKKEREQKMKNGL